ncbi:hypothetical protein GCM10020369_42420 [Cryptosporangium minutisporangium]|uniref:Uncharacterized protein n=1 Tax=Cryptosporangium minutisporangium TaxID=113569 RepID=A0ABP6T0G5_9ACTN
MAQFPEPEGLILGCRPPFGAMFYRIGRYIRLVRLTGFTVGCSARRLCSERTADRRGNDRNAVSIEPVGLNFRLL